LAQRPRDFGSAAHPCVYSDRTGQIITCKTARFNAALPHAFRRLIIAPVMRRIHLPEFSVGKTDLSDAQARYLRDVLRLAAGEAIEVFDAAGSVGRGSIFAVNPDRVTIEIARIEPPKADSAHLSVAAAVPKGPRADWMIEKLAEL